MSEAAQKQTLAETSETEIAPAHTGWNAFDVWRTRVLDQQETTPKSREPHRPAR